jgi:hypothetical protein
MSTLLLILQIFPLVLSAVKAVEEAIPLPGQGKQKLDLVLDVIKSAYDASTELTSAFSWQKLVSLVVPMIDKIVALNNALGLFKKSTPEPSKA